MSDNKMIRAVSYVFISLYILAPITALGSYFIGTESVASYILGVELRTVYIVMLLSAVTFPFLKLIDKMFVVASDQKMTEFFARMIAAPLGVVLLLLSFDLSFDQNIVDGVLRPVFLAFVELQVYIAIFLAQAVSTVFGCAGSGC